MTPADDRAVPDVDRLARSMLSASFGHARVRAGFPPDSRISEKNAQRCDAWVFHWTAVWPGPSLLTETVTWQNRQSTGCSPPVR